MWWIWSLSNLEESQKFLGVFPAKCKCDVEMGTLLCTAITSIFRHVRKEETEVKMD